MSAADGRRWPFAVAAIPVLLLVGGIACLVWSLAVQGPEHADRLASVLGAVLTSVGLATGLLAWAWRRRRQAAQPATAEQVDQAAATLAGAVREQWQQEATARSLGDPEPMPVRWRLTSTNLMDNPTVIVPDGSLAFAGSSDRIGPLAEAFRALPRRRLVIIGGPGTGKSTLAVQVLLELLPPPGEALNGPVPILFSLAGWAPDVQPRVQDWLTDQLEQTYPALRAISPDAAAALVAQGRLLPVLDGLDEVSPVQRPRIIAALNTSLDPDGGLILTSRRAEYRSALAAAGDVLTAAAVIGPLALSPVEAATFLGKHLSAARHAGWGGVLAALTTGSAPNLAAIVSTPLGLWLVCTIYRDNTRSPAPLTDTTRYPSRAALQTHLLDELIPTLVRSRPPLPRRRHDAPDVPLRPARQHRPEDLRRWLTTLAEQLAATTRRPRITDWLWWDLAQHTFPTGRSRLMFQAVAGLAYGLVVGLAGSLASGQPVLIAVSLAMGLAAGLVGIIDVTGLPRHANLRLSGRIAQLLRSLAYGLVGGLAVGLLIGLVGAFTIGLMEALTPGLTAALTIGLALALMDFTAGGDIAERSSSPMRSYRGDRTQAIAAGLMLGLAIGLAIGLTRGLTAGLPAGLAIGLPGGLVIGLAGGLAISAWFPFVSAALWQAVRRRLPAPWRTMAVLDDAHRLGLLRTVGPAYQFRHAELQDHLAPPSPGPTA